MCTTISPSFVKIGWKTKKFYNCPFFCSEFQSVSRIVKIVHSEIVSIRDFWDQELSVNWESYMTWRGQKCFSYESEVKRRTRYTYSVNFYMKICGFLSLRATFLYIHYGRSKNTWCTKSVNRYVKLFLAHSALKLYLVKSYIKVN